MIRAAVVVAVSSVVGGVGLLYNPDKMPNSSSPYSRAYAVEVGVVFDERVIRTALPQGLDPAPGFTGGIAIYGGEEGWALSPLSTGHVWIDVIEEDSGASTRYMLTGFASEGRVSRSTIPSDAAALGEAHELDEDGVLHVVAWPDQVSTLELAVKPSAAHCANGVMAEQRHLLTSGPRGSLGVIHMPAALDWCEVDADAGWASVTAPFGHELRQFVPQQVLWARVATPL